MLLCFDLNAVNKKKNTGGNCEKSEESATDACNSRKRAQKSPLNDDYYSVSPKKKAVSISLVSSDNDSDNDNNNDSDNEIMTMTPKADCKGTFAHFSSDDSDDDAESQLSRKIRWKYKIWVVKKIEIKSLFSIRKQERSFTLKTIMERNFGALRMASNLVEENIEKKFNSFNNANMPVTSSAKCCYVVRKSKLFALTPEQVYDLIKLLEQKMFVIVRPMETEIHFYQAMTTELEGRVYFIC